MGGGDFPCAARVVVEGPAGAIEALTGCPAPASARPATAIVCHPHPLHGGTMQNKVVHTLSRTFEKSGARTLRFNFRGVGASEGAFDHGRGEIADALAALEWAHAHRPHDDLWLAGFSFGAYVAARAAIRYPVARLITVAPAIHLYPDLGGYAPPAIPWLLIQGTADEVVPPQEVINWARGLEPPPHLALLDGASHFFHGRLPDLTAAVNDWLGAP